MGTHEVFHLCAEIAELLSKPRKNYLFHGLVCSYTHAHTPAHKGRPRTHKTVLTERAEGMFSASQRTPGVSANTVAAHSDCKHIIFFCSLALNVTSTRVVSKNTSFLPASPLGVPSSGHHSGNPHPGLRARAKERQRRPDGGTHQDPHLLVLRHEGPRQKVRLLIFKPPRIHQFLASALRYKPCKRKIWLAFSPCSTM